MMTMFSAGVRAGNRRVTLRWIFVLTMFAAVVLLIAPPVQANPSTPQSAIDEATIELCQVITANPTEAGMFDAVTAMEGRGFDEIDAAYTLIAAVHHGCPQHADLMMDIMNAVADDEVCKKEMA